MIAFFQKFVFSTASYVLKNWSYRFHNNCQSVFWTLIYCFLTFRMFDKAEKYVKIFSALESLLFFQQPLRS